MRLIRHGSSTAVDVWDIATNELLFRVDSQFADFDISADASVLAVKPSPAATAVDLYDLTTQQPVGTIPAVVCFVVRLSPTGDRLAIVTATNDGAFGCESRTARNLEVWDVSDSANPRLEHTDVTDNVWDVWWSPDGGSYLTATATGFVRAVDASSHEPIWSHQFEISETSSLGGIVRPTGALFTTDGREVVVGTQFEQTSGILLFTFDMTTGEIVREPTSTAGLGSMNWWNEEETQLVGTLWPSGATVLDLDSASEVLPPPFTNPNATAVWIDRERDRTVVASFVGVEVYALDGSSVLERRVSLNPEQLAIKAETDGQVFASLTGDGDRLWMTALDFAGRIPVIEWDMTTDPPEVIQALPPTLVYGQGDVTLRFGPDFMEVLGSDRQPLGPAVPTENEERGQPFIWRASFDGSTHAPIRVATNVVDVYDTASGERTAELDWPDAEQAGDVVRTDTFSLSADGDHIVTHWLDTDGPFSLIHDTSTAEVVHAFRVDEVGDLPWLGNDTVYSNPPGSFDLERRDIETLEINGPPLVGHTLILNSMIDDPDSDRVVTQATNGNVRVWDRETGEQIGREIAIGRQAAGTDLFAALDGDLVGVIRDTGVAIWNYDVETWPALACRVAGRNMTLTEWQDFGPQGEPYRVTCPEFPSGA